MTNQEVRDACVAVGLHDTVTALPDGYATVVGEGSGHALSGADVLRLVLARVIVRRPKVGEACTTLGAAARCGTQTNMREGNPMSP